MTGHAPPTWPRNQRLALAALGGLAVVVAGALWLWNPAVEGPFPPCPWYWLTGLQCAGCGVLRATHQLLHGELRAAWDLNPLYVASLPLVPLAVLASWRGVRVARPAVLAVAVVVLIGFTIARNVL